jgi:ribosomal-protein-alanine N-acetyltransferase
MPGPVFIHGDGIDLRTIETEDLDFLQESVNDPSIWRAIGRVDPVNRSQEEAFFENVVCEDDSVDLLVTAGGERAGIVSLTPTEAEDDSAELGYWIASDHREQGYGSEAVERMVEFGFMDRGLHRISARVFGFNDASRSLLESLGFTHEGKDRESVFIDGAYQDTHWYSILEHEFPPEA